VASTRLIITGGHNGGLRLFLSQCTGMTGGCAFVLHLK
jgi:hypothetical protein